MRIRDELLDGIIEVKYVPTEENPADMFTKCLTKGQFQKLRYRIGMKSRAWASAAQSSKLDLSS